MNDSRPILKLDDVTIQYRTIGGMLTAVSDASFSIGRSEYFEFVGESRCGKSTIAKKQIGICEKKPKFVEADDETVASCHLYYGHESIDAAADADTCRLAADGDGTPEQGTTQRGDR